MNEIWCKMHRVIKQCILIAETREKSMQRNNCAFRRLFHFWHANDHIRVVTLLYPDTTALYIYMSKSDESGKARRPDDSIYLQICSLTLYT